MVERERSVFVAFGETDRFENGLLFNHRRTSNKLVKLFANQRCAEAVPAARRYFLESLIPNTTTPATRPRIRITRSVVPIIFVCAWISTVTVLSSPVTGWVSVRP